MPWAKHWDIREHIKDFREPSADPKMSKGTEARYTILDYLLLRANPRLRTYVSVDTIMRDTGYTSQTVIAGAIAWLFERGAIYNVPVQFRVGKEPRHHRKYVFQLTGVIQLAGAWYRYLAFSEEDAANMIEEWESIGMEIKVDADFLIAPPGTSVAAGLAPQSEPSLSEPSPNGGQSSKSIESSTKKKNSFTGINAASGDSPAVGYSEKSLEEIISSHTENTKTSVRKKKKKGISPHDPHLLNHEMVKFFMDKCFLLVLSNEMAENLTTDIEYETKEGNPAYIQGGLLGLWRISAGAGFIQQRIPELLAMNGEEPMTPNNILIHLRDVTKDRGDTGRRKPGFFLWHKLNPNIGVTLERKLVVYDEIDIDLFA